MDFPDNTFPPWDFDFQPSNGAVQAYDEAGTFPNSGGAVQTPILSNCHPVGLPGAPPPDTLTQWLQPETFATTGSAPNPSNHQPWVQGPHHPSQDPEFGADMFPSGFELLSGGITGEAINVGLQGTTQTSTSNGPVAIPRVYTPNPQGRRRTTPKSVKFNNPNATQTSVAPSQQPEQRPNHTTASNDTKSKQQATTTSTKSKRKVPVENEEGQLYAYCEKLNFEAGLPHQEKCNLLLEEARATLLKQNVEMLELKQKLVKLDVQALEVEIQMKKRDASRVAVRRIINMCLKEIDGNEEKSLTMDNYDNDEEESGRPRKIRKTESDEPAKKDENEEETGLIIDDDARREWERICKDTRDWDLL